MCIRIDIIVYKPMNKKILYNNQAYTYISITHHVCAQYMFAIRIICVSEITL